MKILLVGSNAALSESLIPILSEKYEVITAARKNADIYFDLEKDINIPAGEEGIDVIVNVAAYFDTDTANIIKSYTINTVGVLKLCLEAKKQKIKHFVQISSQYVCLSSNSLHYTQYAISKKHADEIVKYYCDANKIPLTIIRPSQIYGNTNSFRKNQPFFYAMIDKAERGEDIAIYGSHNPLRNYIHVDDVAYSIYEVIKQKAEGTFPCMYPEDTSFAEIAETALRAYNSDSKIVFLKEQKDILDNIFEKDLSLYETINRFPQIDLKTGIKKIKDFRSRR
jgi:nucleoside-diphosphate-sugar epimerase